MAVPCTVFIFGNFVDLKLFPTENLDKLSFSGKGKIEKNFVKWTPQ